MSKILLSVDAIEPPGAHPAALWLAVTVRRIGLSLATLARRLEAHARRPQRGDREPDLEFYCADAGAPEGALYVDGRLIGYLKDVRRL